MYACLHLYVIKYKLPKTYVYFINRQHKTELFLYARSNVDP